MARSLRIAVLRQEGEWVEGMTSAFKSLGHEARSVMVDERKGSTAESILEFLKSFKPDFCFCENYYVFDPVRSQLSAPLEDHLQKYKIPTAVWYVDSPFGSGSVESRQRWLSDYRPERVTFFCVDRRDVQEFKSRRLSAAHLPLGVNSKFERYRFNVEILQKFQCDLSFCGRPLIAPSELVKDLDDLRSHFTKSYIQFLLSQIHFMDEKNQVADPVRLREYGRTMFAPVFDFFCTFHHRPDLYRESLNRLDGFLKQILPSEYHLLLKIFDHRLNFDYSFFQLAAYLNELADLNIKIFGGEDWKNLLFRSSGRTPFLNDDELFHLFHASKISFSLTKWHFWGAIHERVFMVLACGGLPLTDARDELFEIFDRDEVLSYSSIEEAKDLATRFIKLDGERSKMIEKGRARIFRECTYEIRMKTVVDVMKSEWGLGDLS